MWPLGDKFGLTAGGVSSGRAESCRQRRHLMPVAVLVPWLKKYKNKSDFFKASAVELNMFGLALSPGYFNNPRS